MKAHEIKPITYLCIASEFNLAEFEACLAVQPSDLVLIVSSFDKAQRAAKRLESALDHALPGIRIHRPDTDAPFDGEMILEVQAWINSTLKPYLQQHTPMENQQVLNFTGGTKALSMALLTTLACSRLHYKGIGQNRIQVLEREDNQWLTTSESLEPITATPLEVARLYAGNVRITEGLREQSQLAAPLAHRIWHSLTEQDEGLLQLFNGLECIWSQGRGNPEYQRAQLELPLSRFLQTQDPLPSTLNWIEQLSALSPRALTLENGLLTLPGNSPRKPASKYLRKWICGEWLEELVFQWLRDAGIPKAHLARGVVVSDTQSRFSESGREADLFVHHNGQSSVVEIKADLPPDTDVRSMEQQLSSLGDRYGKTRKVLFVGPELQQKLRREQHWAAFTARFQGSGITLCSDQTTLLQAFGLVAPKDSSPSQVKALRAGQTEIPARSHK